MADERFVIEPDEPYREPNKAAGCLKGCLIAGVVLFVLLLLLMFWVSRNWQRWAADFGAEALNQIIDQSDLPDEEKGEVKVQVERLADAVREGKLSGQQLGRAIEQVLESPLMTSIAVAGIEKKYIEASGLDDQEKENARTELKRFARGLFSRNIEEADFEQALAKIADQQPNGQWKMREKVSDEKLRELVQFVKEKADDAEIPAEAEEVDISDEMQRIIDAALGEAAQKDEAQPD